MDGRKNNKGTKGNRGRPSMINEHTRALVINKSWERIYKKLDSKTVSEAEKDMIAFEIVKRNIPQKIDHSNNGKSFDTYSPEQIDAIISRHYQSSRAKG